MPYPKLHAAAARKYRPAPLKLLFIAEAPPALKSGRFFYFTALTNGDTLFLEMMKVLYPIESHFIENDGDRQPDFLAKHVRQHKAKFLEKFKRDGFYLIDAFEQPMPKDADAATKKRLIRGTLPQLRKKVWKLCHDGDVPVVLIGSPAYSLCAEPLKKDGLSILNDQMIDHPARGGQKKFRRKLREVMHKFTTKARDHAMEEREVRPTRVIPSS
jgi:hypothetical protein